MLATGPGRPMPARVGWGRITTVSNSSKDTGKATVAAVGGITIIGIATIAVATSAAITTTIENARARQPPGEQYECQRAYHLSSLRVSVVLCLRPQSSKSDP